MLHDRSADGQWTWTRAGSTLTLAMSRSAPVPGFTIHSQIPSPFLAFGNGGAGAGGALSGLAVLPRRPRQSALAPARIPRTAPRDLPPVRRRGGRTPLRQLRGEARPRQAGGREARRDGATVVPAVCADGVHQSPRLRLCRGRAR